jgi:hypothetical protein
VGREEFPLQRLEVVVVCDLVSEVLVSLGGGEGEGVKCQLYRVIGTIDYLTMKVYRDR